MNSNWCAGAAEAQLREGAVQVWRVHVDAAHAALLSGEERARAARTRVGGPRDEFVAARGALRRLLGAATGENPEQLRFELGAQGKPRLAGGGEVEFNVTHSGGCVLVALSRAGAVGVDVERLDRAVEALELAQAHFHREEAAQIAEAADEQRLVRFFRCWTRKEAVVKADGRGLQVMLARFCVLGDIANAPIELPDGNAVWLRDLPVEAGYAAALAVADRDTKVELLQLAE